MFAELSATWAAIKAASEAISTALKTVEGAKAKQAVIDIQNSLIDVQTKLLAAQSQYEALAEAKREIENKLVKYEQWEAEAARYELKEIASGIFVYVLKPDHAKAEPEHWLCPNCFQKREKSILNKPSVDHLQYKCHRCDFQTIPTTQPLPQVTPYTESHDLF